MKNVLEFLLKAVFMPYDYKHAFFFVIIWTMVVELVTRAVSVTGSGAFEGLLIDKWGMGDGLATVVVIVTLIALILGVGFVGGKIFKKK